MESTRNSNIRTQLRRKHVKNARLKFETEQYENKKQLVA